MNRRATTTRATTTKEDPVGDGMVGTMAGKAAVGPGRSGPASVHRLPSSGASPGGDAPPPAAALAKELHAARRKRMLSLEQLAALSGVSRSMISKIERAEAVPSTTVLAKLAEALGVTFAQLMSHPVEREVLIIEAAQQPTFSDAASGLMRRCLSPVLPGRGIDFLLNTLPPRGTAGAFGAHRRGVEEYVYVHQGTLEAAIGEERHLLRTGDSLYFQADTRHAFTNVGEGECLYFLIIDSSRLHR